MSIFIPVRRVRGESAGPTSGFSTLVIYLLLFDSGNLAVAIRTLSNDPQGEQ